MNRSKKTASKLEPCAIVVGVGAPEGIGAALCARIALEEIPVFAYGRNPKKLDALSASLSGSTAPVSVHTLDATDAQAIARAFDDISEQGYVPELVIFNAAEANIPKPLLEMTPDYVEGVWRSCCQAGFLIGQEAIARMLPRSSGTLIFTGATASLRGRAKFGAFAAAKAGLRAFAQSMAREFGPKGIHVAHIVIDGVVNGDRVASALGGAGKAYLMSRGKDGALQPEAVAEAYWQVHRQHRSAWTHELDLRPFKEEF